jgi:hypothetical protein
MLACNLSQGTTTQAPPATNTIQQNPLSTFTPASLSTDTSMPSATDTPAPTKIKHTLVPGEPPSTLLSALTDRNSAEFATQKRANGGDNIALNLYERPFNANTMDTYYPFLDIVHASLYAGDPWIFVNITLVGQDATVGLSGVYAVELDLDVDGRGDVLVAGAHPGQDWSTDGVRALRDDNHDVGGPHPVSPDTPGAGDGYETVVFDGGVGSDPDLAWSRVSPADPNSVQLAFKRSLINNDDKFTWDVWAMAETTFNPAWFDINDHFTQADMGSPLAELTELYPIKGVAQLDNTCRWSVGFTLTGTEPGICALPATPTPVLPGKITGQVFNDDVDKDGVFGTGSYPYQNIPIEIHAGTCSGDLVASTASNTEGFYSVSVPAGTYCVEITQRPDPNGAAPQTVKVPNGGTVPNVNFAFW